MTPKGRSWRMPTTVAILLLGSPLLLWCRAGEMQATPAPEVDLAERGQKLFAGKTRFRNGGPPCAVCHTSASLPFPGGGSLGPDLTGISAKLGPLGIDPTLQTLFFPAMISIYDPHPLEPDERDDLKAFFRAEGARQPSREGTPVLLALALVGLSILLILTHLFGRRRLRGVRKRLLERAAGAGGPDS